MIFLIIIFIFMFILLVHSYNGFVRLNNDVREAFATMDVYLKKRWDLIPNLVNTVKGYTTHELDVLKGVIELRNASYNTMSDDRKIAVNEQLSSGINKIVALSESYPDLKASENFKDLSAQLATVENDIANARKYYNGTVRIFNNKIQVFPNNLLAKLFGFKAVALFGIDSVERENVNVNF